MGMSAVLSMAKPKRGRGRGRASRPLSDLERLRHVRVAYDHLVCQRTLSEVSLLHGIPISTAHRWVGLALTYDDPEAEGLRRELAARKLNRTDPA